MKKILTKISVFGLFIAFFGGMVSCEDVVQPKPSGYYRIDLPDREFKQWRESCPFEFKVSNQAVVTKSNKVKSYCYYDLTYPNFNATLYLSYLPVKNNLKSLVDQEFTMREKHNAFSTGTNERLFRDLEHKVSAMIFDVKGVKAATPLQFFVTDSVNHFFRGALYFYNSPNNDSLAPVIEYIRQDIDTLISSFRWKD